MGSTFVMGRLCWALHRIHKAAPREASRFSISYSLSAEQGLYV
jgi:hypothetical protein